MLKSKAFIRGMDISKHEPYIDWEKVVKDDIHYVIMKATQGTRKDRDFTRLWKEAKGIMPRGAYHFFDGLWFSNKPKRQVETFIEALDGDLGELPLVVDIEGIFANGPGRYTGWKNWYDVLEYLKQAIPDDKKIMIYTNVGSWNHSAPRGGKLDYFTRLPLWVANYKTKIPLIPRGWDRWLFWQYSQDAFVDGVVGRSNRLTTVDVNWFNGSADDLKLLAGMEVPLVIAPEASVFTSYSIPTQDKPKPVVTIMVQGDVEIKVKHDNS